MGAGYSFKDDHFSETIFYFTNYVKLINVNEDKINDELKRYYQIESFEEEFVSPIIKIRANAKNNLNDNARNKIVPTHYK